MTKEDCFKELYDSGYIVYSYQGGTTLVIETHAGKVVFYPNNGFFEGKATGRGFKKLLHELRKLRGVEI